MIPFIDALKKINYGFDSMGACSMVTVNHTIYGRLDFHWEVNKSKIKLLFVNYNNICICDFPDDIVKCDCDWIALQEGPTYPIKIFTKSQVEKLKQPTLF